MLRQHFIGWRSGQLHCNFCFSLSPDQVASNSHTCNFFTIHRPVTAIHRQDMQSGALRGDLLLPLLSPSHPLPSPPCLAATTSIPGSDASACIAERFDAPFLTIATELDVLDKRYGSTGINIYSVGCSLGVPALYTLSADLPVLRKFAEIRQLSQWHTLAEID